MEHGKMFACDAECFPAGSKDLDVRQARRNVSASDAHASIRCSQLSRMSKSDLGRI